jgi:hypothetical protein
MTPGSTTFETTVWQSLRRLWCQHRRTATIPKTAAMPAHVVCQSCGWREPVIGARPTATRTWDSTRDEVRYEREKKRREAVEQQRLLAMAQLAAPVQKPARPRRSRRGNVVDIHRAVGQ